MHGLRGRGWTVVAAAALVASAALSGCSASAPAPAPSSSGGGGDDPNNASLTYWYWGEPDAPGANDWMKGRITAYEALHPGVKIDLVPQGSDTLIGSFATAVQTKSGPDIATQWATLPVLSPAWAGAVAPLDDLIPASDRSTWIGTSENTDGGKLYGVPLYVIGIPLAYNKTLFAKAGIAQAPATFSDLLADCSALKKVGITPIGAGNKDQSFGAWFFSNFGVQNLDSVADLKKAIVGTNDISDPKYMGYLQAFEQLMSAGCFSSDVASTTLADGGAAFGSGKAAMTWGTDGQVVSWAKALGQDVIGIAPTPKWGTGMLADVYNTTQSSTAIITSWSQHKKAAAQFLTWLHTPENLASWYAATGVFPADSRFDSTSLKTDLDKAMWALDAKPGAVWLENYLPPSLDNDGDRVAGQVITSGGTAKDAAAAFVAATQKWRTTNPDDFKNYSAWASR